MEVNFKFEVGDYVVEKVMMEAYRLEAFQMYGSKLIDGKLGAPRIMTVINRSAEQCPGGIQYHYVCRGWKTQTERVTINYNEIELEAWDGAAFIGEFTAAYEKALATKFEETK